MPFLLTINKFTFPCSGKLPCKGGFTWTLFMQKKYHVTLFLFENRKKPFFQIENKLEFFFTSIQHRKETTYNNE